MERTSRSLSERKFMSERKLRHELAGAREERDGRGVDRTEAGHDRSPRRATAIFLSSRINANRSCLRTGQARVIEIGAVEDVVELGADREVGPLLDAELAADAEVLDGAAFAAEVVVVGRAAELPGSRIGP